MSPMECYHTGYVVLLSLLHVTRTTRRKHFEIRKAETIMGSRIDVTNVLGLGLCTCISSSWNSYLTFNTCLLLHFNEFDLIYIVFIVL